MEHIEAIRSLGGMKYNHFLTLLRTYNWIVELLSFLQGDKLINQLEEEESEERRISILSVEQMNAEGYMHLDLQAFFQVSPI